MNTLGTDDSEDDDTPSAPFWMTTYGDVMTLLVTFFVLLISMSEVRQKKFRDAISNFQQQPGIFSGNTSVISTRKSSGSNSSSPDTPSDSVNVPERARKYEQFVNRLEENGLGDKVQANLTEEGVHVIIADSVMFRTGEARLIEPARSILEQLAKMLGPDVKSVIVEGHTDTQPISTRRFPSNWELSTARAASTVRFLQENNQGYDSSRFTAVGYGANHPRATNETPEGRAKNRRVEIKLSWESWQNQTTRPTGPGEKAPDMQALRN